jgi:hypothetical protein
MSKKLCNLKKRQQTLVQDAAEQRLLLTKIVEAWRARLLLADQSIAVIANIKQHPVLAVTASLGILTVMRSSLMCKWLRRGLLTWQVVHKVRAFYVK